MTSGPGYQQEKVTVRQTGDVEHQERVVENEVVEKRLSIQRATQFVMLIFGALEALIGLRIVLKLIGANSGNQFAQWIYDLSAPFLTPFMTLVGNPGNERLVLEVTSLIAMVVYGLFCWALVALIRVVFMPTRARAVTIVDKERRS